MSKVVKEEIDKLNATLSITLEKTDYEQQFNEELAKYKKHAHMKGFRKGKTPMSVVKKMYGNAVLGDVINQQLQSELMKFINEAENNLLGYPISAKDQQQVDFDHKEMHDYTFKFDLGMAPEFELKGLDDDHEFTIYKVDVTEEMVDEDLQNARRHMGDRIDVEEDIQENDLIRLVVKELDEDKNVKENGITSDFSILAKDIADEELRQEILGKKAGDTLTLSLIGLEEHAGEKFVKDNYLRDPDFEGDIPAQFEATIDHVSRIEPAEMNEEFFQQLFGDEEIKDETAAREKIKEETEKFFNRQSEALLFRELQDHLMEQNELPLPDEFLKRWLVTSNEELDEKEMTKEYPLFADNLRWTLIKSKLTRKYDIQITQEDIREVMKNRVKSYFANSPYGSEESIIETMADRLMQDQKQVEQVREEVLSDKLFEAVTPDLNKVEKVVSHEEFNEIAQKAKAETMAASVKEETSGDNPEENVLDEHDAANEE